MTLLPADVNKKILSGGKKEALPPPYPPGTKVKFHYLGRLRDSEEVIDNTRTMTKPMELIIGKKFKMEIWEQMIQTMIEGEKAEFQVPKSYVSCYPMVAKAVRDSNRPKTERSHQHHCCGMMQQGIGYADLDKLIENPDSMTFVFDLLSVEWPGEYEQESWQLNEQEKLASVPLLQSKGNQLFADGDFKGAETKYFEAIARLEQLSLRERPQSEEAHELDMQKLPLLLNYSLCLMKKEEYYEAIQHLTTALALQPENVKGLFRRGKCHKAVGNFSEAREDFGKAVELDPSLKSSVTKQFDEMATEQKIKDLQDKLKFQKIFNEG